MQVYLVRATSHASEARCAHPQTKQYLKGNYSDKVTFPFY